MPPSRSEYLDFLKHQERVSSTPAPNIDVALGMIKTAAVSFDHLTNKAEWDRYLSMIQGELEAVKKEREGSLSLCGGAVGDALLRAQLAYQYHSGYVKALEAMLSLPRQVIEQYEGLKK
jgi:hypothetical protein